MTVLGAELHLASFAGDGAFGTAVYIRSTEVDGLARRLRENAPGCSEHGPEDRPWGQRELDLRDPDNDQLRIGQPVAGRGAGRARH